MSSSSSNELSQSGTLAIRLFKAVKGRVSSGAAIPAQSGQTSFADFYKAHPEMTDWDVLTAYDRARAGSSHRQPG